MPNKSNRRPVPSNYKQELAILRLKSSKKVISLLDRCLTSHCLEDSRHEECIVEVSKVLDLVHHSCDESSPKSTSKDQQNNSSTKKTRRDEHNEVCEVCETGGGLLCCDTCNLVFHLACTRPKLSAAPKGKWSCSHCIVDGVAAGDKGAAKIALRSMSRIARGIDSGDEGDDHAERIMRSGEVTVIRSGKRFIVRRTTRSQIVELGRYDSIEKALSSLSPDAEDEELWCMFCLDDPNIKLCAFCGCRCCFGKHDVDYLLLCDGCNEETHTYCLSPQLTAIPNSNWFCAPCIQAGRDVEGSEGSCDVDDGDNDDGEHAKNKQKAAIATKKYKQSLSSEGTVETQKLKSAKIAGRGRGRPPGSGKKLKEGVMDVDHDSTLGPVSMVVAAGDDKKCSSSSSAPKIEENGIPLTVDAVGIDAALAIVGHIGRRELGKIELQLLEHLREWAPVGDLEAVLNALVVQRDRLAARIQTIEPDYCIPQSDVVSVTVSVPAL